MGDENKKTALDNVENKSSAAENEEAVKSSELPDSNDGSESSASQKDRKKAMKNDRQYRRGRHIYSLGTWLLIIYLLGFSAKKLIGLDIIIGEMFVSVYLSLLVIVPIALMIIGMSLSQRAAQKYDIDEKNKPWIVVLSIAGVVMIALAVCEILMPSYKVYDLEIMKYREGTETMRPSQELIVTQYCSGTIFHPAPETKPGYSYIDVYAKYGIIALRKATAANNNGSFEIKPGDASNDYVLMVSSLGHDEQFRFTY